MKKFLIALLIIISLALVLLVVLKYIDNSISQTYKEDIYQDISKLPHKKAALVLGTAKHFLGRENLFFNARIDAAVALFKAGKVDAIVVSGDNGSKSYDEPTDMRDDLVKRGVPEKFITLDYAGFSTLDSIVRAKAIFDLDDFIVVSQKFHIQRALYIADKKGIKAIGFVAKDIEGFWGQKVRKREILARFKAFLDLNILYTEPKFYGDKVEVIYKEI
jgi:SanA protein